MKINANIFNDMVDVSEKIENIQDLANSGEISPDTADDIQDDIDDQYSDLTRALAKQDIDPDDLKDAIKDCVNDGEDKADAKDDAVDALIQETIDDGMQIWFIPDDTVLASGLRLYYSHVAKVNHLNLHGYFDQFKKFANGVNSSDIDNPFSQDGFFIDTGMGYDIKDELFAGVPIKNRQHPDGVGSGIPSKRFLNYINSHN